MFTRIQQVPNDSIKSFFLFGPRGTGKTTWLKQQFPNALYIDLLKTETLLSLQANPSRLESMIPSPFSEYVILDEVQRIPALLDEVHRLIEGKQYSFILTGSSARSLRKKGVNLLAGRALTSYMFPLTAIELGKSFAIEKSLEFGHLPSVFMESAPNDYLKSYIHTYLREEILQEGLTRNLNTFSRFLEIASFSQGSLINYSEIAREVGADRKLIEGYFQILEDLLIAKRISVFSKRSKRRLVQHQKFYYFDAGVYRAIRPKGPLDRPEESEGGALETLVFQEIIAINHYYRLDYELFFWRTSSGLEVDFILYGERGIIAIEVKRALQVHKKDLGALKAFCAEYPMAKALLVYGGTETLYFDNITAIPVTDFLKNLDKYLDKSRA